MGPTVSVITISRNNLDGLRRTRASVEQQSCSSLEHVVIDGGSSDGTRGWLEGEAHVRWTSEADRGRYDAMNKGAARASGELLWFLHAGDLFASKDSVARVVSDWLDRHWKWAYGCARLLDETGAVVGISAPIPYRRRLVEIGMVRVPHQAACFDRQFFAQLGGYDTEFGLAADQLFMLKAARASTPAIIPEFLCDFDNCGAGTARSPYRHYRDAARARRILDPGATSASVAAQALVGGVLATFEAVKSAVGRRLRD